MNMKIKKTSADILDRQERGSFSRRSRIRFEFVVPNTNVFCGIICSLRVSWNIFNTSVQENPFRTKFDTNCLLIKIFFCQNQKILYYLPKKTSITWMFFYLLANRRLADAIAIPINIGKNNSLPKCSLTLLNRNVNRVWHHQQ